MSFKRLQARGVPFLSPFKKICLTGTRRWVPRAGFSNTAVIRHEPATGDTSVSLVHWQEPYSHRGRVLRLTVAPASFPASGVYRGASRTIDLGSSPAPFKRLRPFKESAAQQLLKPAINRPWQV